MKDEEYMRRALEISILGNPSPNPYVGAVLVRDGKVISEGYHHKAGMDHAEVEAMKGVDPKGATLYVTLEPCSHYGRTPPCSKAIIAAEVSEVVYAVEDPTEKVKGHEELAAAGLIVRSGILKEASERVNEVFFKFSRTGRPFVVLKSAMTLDGQIATSAGESKWISGEDSRQIVHVLRSRYDAVLVGVNTVLKDDPHLTARIPEGRNPLKVILDSSLRTPAGANVLKDGNAVLATTEKADPARVKELEGKATIWVLGKERVDWDRLLAKLGERGVTSVMIEGGSAVNYSAVKAGIVDKYIVCMAPKIMAGRNTPAFGGEGIKTLDEAAKLRFTAAMRVGEDIMFEAYPLK